MSQSIIGREAIERLREMKGDAGNDFLRRSRAIADAAAVTTTGIELVVAFGAVGAFVQTVTGFGGALVLAPVLFGTMQPAQAVLLSALLGIVQSGVLVARNSGQVLRRELSWLVAAAIPGLAVGVVVLRIAPSSVLRVIVGVTVIVATILRRLLGAGRPMADSAALPAGFLAGVLTTSATVNGPPLVLFLTGRGATAAQMRGTLAGFFLAADTLTLGVLAIGDTLVLPPLAAAVALAISFPLGLLAGLWFGDRMPERHYASAVAALLLALGVSSIVTGVS
jgi:uncharacterized membrane protein YfcA